MSMGSYTVYRDVLENRQVGGTFKLVNLKREDRPKIFSKYFGTIVVQDNGI